MPTAPTGNGPWLHPAAADPEADLRLFLLHHSGGNATLYRDWPTLLPRSVSCQAIQLPGRHIRSAEPLFTRLAPLVEALTAVLEAELDDRPYALLGHSMGALLAYRVAVAAPGRGLSGPTLLAASGWAPEGFSSPRVPSTGTAGQILQAVAELGTNPAQLAADPELLQATTAALRADGAVCADYRDDGAGVPCPIVGYAGTDDPLLAPTAMNSWAGRTHRYLGTRRYPGGHFFIQAHAPAMAADLVQLLRRLSAEEQPHPARESL